MLRKTPEAKGILIYLLTRHAFSDHINLDNRGEDVPLDIYHYRKKAILVILASIQTQREYFQVFSHFNAKGSDLANGNSSLKYLVAQHKVNELKEYLQEGSNRDTEVDSIYRRLIINSSWGYALAMNNTEYYLLNTTEYVFYPKLFSLSPLDGSNNA